MNEANEVNEAPETPKYDADKLVRVYIKMRDARDALVSAHEKELAALTDQMSMIEAELLDLCNATGQDGGRTKYGTFTRTTKVRYWTSDWDSMRAFIKQHDAMDLLEQRIHQTNMRNFLRENPDSIPAGLNADSRYSITVRRASTKAS